MGSKVGNEKDPQAPSLLFPNNGQHGSQLLELNCTAKRRGVVGFESRIYEGKGRGMGERKKGRGREGPPDLGPAFYILNSWHPKRGMI